MQGTLENNPFYNFVKLNHFSKLLECDVMLIPNEVSFVASQKFSEIDVCTSSATTTCDMLHYLN